MQRVLIKKQNFGFPVPTPMIRMYVCTVPSWFFVCILLCLGGRSPEAYGSRRVCVCVCVSFTRISLQRLKTKR